MPILRNAALLFATTIALCLHADEAVVRVHADEAMHRTTRYLTGACLEDVNHEVYGGIYSQMVFGESFQEPAPQNPAASISGMWRELRRGVVEGVYSLETNAPFAGRQSQRITFLRGQGELGIENQGLNRRGIAFVGSRSYEGSLWVRAERPVELSVALERRDGAGVSAEERLRVSSQQWQRLDFCLTPTASDPAGRFAVKLLQPGSLAVGLVFLEPGDWGRFHGLPVRKDVVNGLRDQGVTVLRYGGSMVNHREYRWKNMLGPRDRRPPVHGTWYEYSSNGWGIPDFLNLCDAAGFLAVPDFNINESPQDLADFLEYANGPADSQWGRRRVADGHPQPYSLRYLELGNEERVDEDYAGKFAALAKAIWAKDPEIILVVGDFSYHGRIQDPYHFSGADSGITTLAAHERILRLAKEQQREVWFDVHVWTEGPRPDSTLDSTLTYCDALDKIAAGAAHKVVVFELNANNHSQRRALANAVAINTAQRDGRLPIVASANCLQPDGQNGNGWDQGLLFLNPSAVWLQPPGYVTRMMAHNDLPVVVKSEVDAPDHGLDVCATRSDDGKTLVLQMVNMSEQPIIVRLQLAGFTPRQPWARVEELAAPLASRNTAQNPKQTQTVFKAWPHGLTNGTALYPSPPCSFTVIRFE